MADAILDTSFFIDLYRGDRGAIELWATISQGAMNAAVSPIAAFELTAASASERAEVVYARNLRDFARFPVEVRTY